MTKTTMTRTDSETKTTKVMQTKLITSTAIKHYKNNEKSAQRETQTLHAGCSKAEPKIFAPLQTHFQGRRTAEI